MTAPNTINREEYAQRLFEACRRMSKRLSRLKDEEYSKEQTADNKRDNEKALKHYFNSVALNLAMSALLKTPEELKKLK